MAEAMPLRFHTASFDLGAAFLLVADAVARIVLGQTELPVGAITGILG
jgi:ABC-type Fe3+-siderophore transport system permease subunit